MEIESLLQHLDILTEGFDDADKSWVVFTLSFANKAHFNQVRKYTEEPYINHPINVAKILKLIPHDANMICAALLHDVVEDCGVTFSELRDLFQKDVVDLVAHLTDISKRSDGNRTVRKMIDRHHTANGSYRSKTIKVADMLDNSCSIIRHDPNFARIYLIEKRKVLHLISGSCNAFLWRAAADMCSYWDYDMSEMDKEFKEMENKKFLKWIYKRMVDVHHENPQYAYMIKFKEILDLA